jgi:hypothetical protein
MGRARCMVALNQHEFHALPRKSTIRRVWCAEIKLEVRWSVESQLRIRSEEKRERVEIFTRLLSIEFAMTSVFMKV